MLATTGGDDDEFTIRVTGEAPPPASTAVSEKPDGGKKKASSGRSKARVQGGGGGGGGGGDGGRRRRFDMRLRPSMTFDALRKRILDEFFEASSNNGRRVPGSYEMSILVGFPPRELTAIATATVRDLGIRPNEGVIARFVPSSTSTSDGGGDELDDETKMMAGSTTNDEADAAGMRRSEGDGGGDDDDGPRRGKRASALAAAASFRDVIAAQDAAMKKEKSAASNREKGGVTAARRRGDVGNNIVGLGIGTGPAAGGGGKRRKASTMEGAGYRLSDGKTFAGSSSKTSRRDGREDGGAAKSVVAGRASFKGEDDVATKLLSSLGGGGGNVGKYLRSAMRGAVARTYEASRAAARVTAVDAGEYVLTRVKGGSVVDGGGVVLGTADDHDHRSRSEGVEEGGGGGVAAVDDGVYLGRTLYNVSYTKGMDGRGMYEERVEIIGLSVLRSVLESVYNTNPSSHDTDTNNRDGHGENVDGRLRPVLIAQLSPRAFWSLVYHCSDGSMEERRPATGRLSVPSMLRKTMPNLDWSHLDRGGRMRALSEKARENLRQLAVGGGAVTGFAADGTSEKCAEARVQAIEDLAESAINAAMADEDAGSKLTERELRARAAMARFDNANGTKTSPPKHDLPPEDDWTLVTPQEDDIDELIECIMEGAPSIEGGESSDAHCTPYDETTARYWAGILLHNDAVRNWREMANSEPNSILTLLLSDENSHPPQHHPPTCDAVEKWIDASRSRALEEIMLEILDGDQDALESLQENARSCTPRDLTFWKSAPTMLLDAMSPPPRPTDEASTSSPALERRWEKADAIRWIKRAGIALGACTWLELYTSRSVP
ncbi:hypothetical protein ACHAXA_009161 [Cyclostephanos tholiformis]|uniref:Uncharacterized protein n=1 Tax=Cyclostephanos tholiformis TaxID=382380 RepID=A0ABD3RTJ1_9STRA